MDAPVLLTGATGYIGGRLLRHFEETGRPVRCLARNPDRIKATGSTTAVVQGDCLDDASLGLALTGVDSAYYLVHSMSVGADFAQVEGLKKPTMVRSSAAFDAFQIEPTPLRVALAKAIAGGARLRQAGSAIHSLRDRKV